jgi:hypothetical protein
MVSNIAFPALLGEMAFMLWLVIMGVNVRKWEKREKARRADIDVHAGPLDLLNHFKHRNHDLTVVAIA